MKTFDRFAPAFVVALGINLGIGQAHAAFDVQATTDTNLLAAALVYCISYGMPVSIIIVVLFIYGFFLQLLLFGLALSGVFIAQYIGKPKNAG